MPSITFWNRLEASPRANDLREPLAARVRDAAWMLARQWQLGEFHGEDAASPAWVEFSADLRPLVAWSAGNATRPLDGATPLERVVEAEPFAIDDLSTAVELGLVFERLLAERGLQDLIGEYRTAYSFTPAADDDVKTARLCDLWRGRVVDGVGLWRAARDTLPGLPPPAVPGREDGVRGVLEALVQWVDEVYGGLGADDPPAWDRRRLEYAASVTTGGGEASTTLAAHPGRNGELDWYSFEGIATPASDVPPAPGLLVEQRLIPAAVRFRGMPNPRWWDFEDHRVDFGAVTADRRDLARLILLDFLLVHGNDWFVIPFDQPLGTLCRLTSLVVRDVFGGDTPVRRGETRNDPASRWTLFSTTTADGFWGDWFLVPSSAGPATLGGPTLEEARFLRDETANMAWAIEVATAGRLGEPIPGLERAVTAAAEVPAAFPPTALRYQIQTDVPAYWIPFVPVTVEPSTREIALELAALLPTLGPEGTAPVIQEPLGKILRPAVVAGAGYRIREEEVSREGTRIIRVVQFSRWTDGSAHLWIARHRSVGAGEGWSGLRFDLARLPQR